MGHYTRHSCLLALVLCLAFNTEVSATQLSVREESVKRWILQTTSWEKKNRSLSDSPINMISIQLGNTKRYTVRVAHFQVDSERACEREIERAASFIHMQTKLYSGSAHFRRDGLPFINIQFNSNANQCECPLCGILMGWSKTKRKTLRWAVLLAVQ